MTARKRTGPGANTTDGRIAENLSIDACITECFQHLHSSDVRRYKKEFQSQPHDQDQVLHTFRELLFGSYLARNGWRVRAYQKIDGKTPDWSVFSDNDDLRGIIDVVNLDADKSTETGSKRCSAKASLLSYRVTRSLIPIEFTIASNVNV